MQCKTRKSSFVKARGIPTAAYQVLHPLSYPRIGEYLPWPGGVGWVPTLVVGTLLWCEQIENIIFSHPSDAVGNYVLREKPLFQEVQKLCWEEDDFPLNLLLISFLNFESETEMSIIYLPFMLQST